MIAKNVRGFSLIELMVVVVVIGILASIAYPSYMDSVRKGRRSDGKSALLATSQSMERYFTENTSYNGPTLSDASTIGKTTSPENYYTIAFDSAPTGDAVCAATSATNSNASAYRICATPTGPQSSDSCGMFSLSSTGVRTPTTAGCW